jgi:hypothetical protein
MLALKGRRYEEAIMIQNQPQATLVEFKRQDSANVFNKGENTGLTLSSRNGSTSIGIAGTIRKMLLL